MSYVPKVACINDLSGFGRCSLTTAISVLSACGVQPCPAPTAILSKHTGYPQYYFCDFTDRLGDYLDDWKKVQFDAVYTGFLGSASQIEIVENFVKSHNEKSKIIIDTVMGDNGKLYSTYTNEMCEMLKTLITHADLITPNVTEACFLTDTEYDGDDISMDKAEKLSEMLLEKGCKASIITGISNGNEIISHLFAGEEHTQFGITRTNNTFSGAGDIFSSIICGMMCRGIALEKSLPIAMNFIRNATELTIESHCDINDGILYEPLLHQLSMKGMLI